MSATESERSFDPEISSLLDAYVAAHGVEAAEERIMEQYGPDSEHYGRQQEALAYLRKEHAEGDDDE